MSDLKRLHDQYDYSYGQGDESSSVPMIPYHQNVTFEQPWVLVQSANIWAIPGCELASGVIAFILQLVVFIQVGRFCFARKQNASGYGSGHWAATALAASMALAVTALFIYVFAVSGTSISQSHLYLNGYFGGVGWDETPTWEVWTCAVSSLLDKDTSVTAARSEWKTICRLTMGARWALLPVFILVILSASAMVISQYSSRSPVTAKPRSESLEML
ncbi:hypothetical protein VHEMI04298 [[Torrubiella] hemipterigena]|uniref:Transmembrane protein n=1 Tax=[Torrubiella] hemipterigena TaxID=1531966 RepID=A0A0A1TFY1_9HYPO|nr:hypothetical protein VHEMI04298 [[Torrubiella] hemipterigena]